jgi:hypothetical protein
MIIKESYKDSKRKKIVQKEVYKEIKGKYTHLIGLGGPDLNEYLKLAKYAGIKNALIYEFNVDQLLIQASKPINTLSTRVIFGDIYQSPCKMKDTFYDFDFCCSVKTAQEHIKKFKNDPVLFTFSIRPLGLNNSIKLYVSSVQKSYKYNLELIKVNPFFRKYQLNLKDSVQTVYIYRDSVPMLVINNNK